MHTCTHTHTLTRLRLLPRALGRIRLRARPILFNFWIKHTRTTHCTLTFYSVINTAAHCSRASYLSLCAAHSTRVFYRSLCRSVLHSRIHEKISRISSAFYPSFRLIGSPALIKKEPVRALKYVVYRKCTYATAVTQPRSV